MSAHMLADMVLADLAERGVPLQAWPSRDAVVIAVYPLARKRVRDVMAVAKAERLAQGARAETAREAAVIGVKLGKIAKRYAKAPVPALPDRLARTVPMEHGQWALGLVPAGAAAHREREAA